MDALFSTLTDFITPWRGDAAAIGAALLWSVGVIYFRLAGYSVGPLMLNLYKSTIAMLLFLITLAVAGGPWLPDLALDAWIRLILSALFGITLGDVLFLASLNRLGAGFQAIIDCTYAPFVLILAFVMFDESLPLQTILGGGLVVTAVVVGSIQPDLATQDRAELWTGILYGVLAQLCMTFCVLMIRDIIRSESLLWITAFRFTVGNGLLVIWTAMRYKRRIVDVFRWGPASKAMLIGAVLGPFLATMCWLLGFKFTLAGRAGIYNQLSTIFIIILAAVFLKEPLSKRRIAALALGVGGALLVAFSEDGNVAAEL